MSSASDPTTPPPLPPPSVFISYASEDRVPTRLLREALTAAGLDVWYDENELGGGDAWDQKIRRQIRECTYFMPVVSATTERRREGYFRREWRLATERSMDMADDVMFLVPVAIDHTAEATARVPEKFLTVQWLRLPGGQPTPALTALSQRLLAHDHAQPPSSRSGVPPPAPPRSASRPSGPAPTDEELDHLKGPPQLPPFPQKPTDSHHKPKYFMEVVWWVCTSAWLTFRRLPKLIRALIVAWLTVAVIFKGCRSDPDTSLRKAHESAAGINKSKTAKPDPDDDEVDPAKAIQAATEKLEKTANEKDTTKLGAGFARAGAEIMRAVSEEIKKGDAAKNVVGIIPFDAGLTESAESKFAGQVFKAVLGELAVARPERVKPLPLTDEDATDEQRRELARLAGDGYFISARIEDAATGGERVLVVRLFVVKTHDPVWSSSYPVTGSDVASTASQIAEGVTANLPK